MTGNQESHNRSPSGFLTSRNLTFGLALNTCSGPYLNHLLTLLDGVVTVAVRVVGHVSEQRVVGMRVFGTQAVCICSCVCAAPPCEFAWKEMQQMDTF